MGRQRRWLLFWLWILTSFCVLGSLVGCRGLTSPIDSLSTPFFVPTSEDVPRLGKLAHELDRKALQCVEAANCEQVSFDRAMVSLFENREAARASFRHVIEHNQASPLAHSSQLWLQLIETHKDSTPLTEIAAEFVRDWLERKLNNQPFQKPAASFTAQEQFVEPSRVVQVLQRQVRERDRQLADLRGQLEALRAIDQEHAEKQRKVKPPASLTIADPYAH
jgi:hypothetical protein